MLKDPGGIRKEVVSEENRETKSEIWFSNIEEIWNVKLDGTEKKFEWTGKSQMWDWDNCTVSWLPLERDSSDISNKTIRVVIRSLQTVFSEYRKKKVKLRYMLGFDADASKIESPKEELYKEPLSNEPKIYGQEKTRWVIYLDNDHLIWQWKEEGKKIESSEVYEIYKDIMKTRDQSVSVDKRMFNVVADDDNEIGKHIVPIIYQPAIDSLKNFVREVHCSPVDNGKRIQVSILFNNEQLREHKILNGFYEWFRSWRYGRVIDVETFYIVLKKDKEDKSNSIKNNNDSDNNYAPQRLDFENIYSGPNDMEEDTIHLDGCGIDIKYYFGNERHPIVFINTSNHAMAEHDTNHRLWKWEYIAWQKDGPIKYGKKSRQKIDKKFETKLGFW